MSGDEVLYAKSSKKPTDVNSDDTSPNDDDDVWDDTVLIEAYNNAVHNANGDGVKTPSESSDFESDDAQKKILQWNVGDQCRCEFSEDHIYYEADIVDVIHDLDVCVVKYVGYENEEQVPMNKLKQSKGELARSTQIKQALKVQIAGAKQVLEKESEESDSQSEAKESSGKNDSAPQEPAGNPESNENATAESNTPPAPERERQTGGSTNLFKQSLSRGMPPPPPPEMFNKVEDITSESEAMNAMLMSWYMSGYHTGYYHGMKATQKK